jgi:hypothetical protein
MLSFSYRAALTVLAVPCFALACSDDDATGTAPLDESTREATISSETASFVTLAGGPQVVAVTDPVANAGWELQLSTLNVNTNVNAGVRVHCLCGNAQASNAEIAVFSPANQLAAFNAVTAANIPADDAFSPDVFAPAISGWATGTGTAAVANPDRLIVLRRGSTELTFVKVRVTAVTAPTATSIGSVTIDYAVQPTVGAAFNAVQSATIAQGGQLEFASGTAGTATSWDIKLTGLDLVLNSGVSGAGSTVGISLNGSPGLNFNTLTGATAGTIQPTTFRRDGLVSVFGSQPWYKYNITGTDLQVWPMFNVYLVKRGTQVWKVQLTSYYNLTGDPRNITIRSARLQ